MPVRKSAANTTKTGGTKRRTTRKATPTTDHAAIAERAYFIHLDEGSHDQVSNWLRAEHELTAA